MPKMPVYGSLLKTHPSRLTEEGQQPLTFDQVELLREGLAGSVVVNGQTPHDVVRERGNARGQIVSALSDYCLLPPFDMLWIEWEGVITDAKDGSAFDDPHVYLGVLVTHDPEDHSLHFMPCRQIALNGKLYPPLFLPVITQIVIDPVTGRVNDLFEYAWKGVDVEWLLDKMPVYSQDAGQPVKQDIQGVALLRAVVDIACSVITFMNCKNVTVTDGGKVHIPRTTSEKRRRPPDVRYRTIVLPGTTGGNRGKGALTREELALHKVRGHFKTFTPERPLMGKHVGTYWWGWQVRGAAEHGVNVNDYRVAR